MLFLFFTPTQHAQKTLHASPWGYSTVLYTHSEHGTEIAEISEQLLHRGLLGINSEVLQ